MLVNVLLRNSFMLLILMLYLVKEKFALTQNQWRVTTSGLIVLTTGSLLLPTEIMPYFGSLEALLLGMWKGLLMLGVTCLTTHAGEADDLRLPFFAWLRQALFAGVRSRPFSAKANI